MSLLLPEQHIHQRYQILSLLRQGTDQQTYLALDQETKTEVILKAMPLSHISDWKSLDLFENEAKTLRYLKHDRIPRLIDSFRSTTEGDNVGYLVTEKIAGESLAERLVSGWKATEAKGIQIADDLLQVIVYLHGFSPPVIHRDIKPANLILDREDRPYLIDFGAVKNLLKDDPTVVGSFGYMAPEQFARQVVPASDLYALGVTLIEMLSLCPPEEIPRRNLQLDYHALVNLSPGFRQWLDRLVEADLSARWATAAQALNALQSLANQSQSVAMPAQQPEPNKTVREEHVKEIYAEAPALTRIHLEARPEALKIQIPPHGGLKQALGAALKNLLVLMGCFGLLAFSLSLFTANGWWFGLSGGLILLLWLAMSSDESKAISQEVEIQLTPRHLIYHVLQKGKPIRSVSYQVSTIREISFTNDIGIQLFLTNESPHIFCKLNPEEAAWLRSEILCFLKPHLEPDHWHDLCADAAWQEATELQPSLPDSAESKLTET